MWFYRKFIQGYSKNIPIYIFFFLPGQLSDTWQHFSKLSDPICGLIFKCIYVALSEITIEAIWIWMKVLHFSKKWIIYWIISDSCQVTADAFGNSIQNAHFTVFSEIFSPFTKKWKTAFDYIVPE